MQRIEKHLRARASGAHEVLAQYAAEAFLLEFADRLGLQELAVIRNTGKRVGENVGKSAGHARTEIRSRGTENENDSGGHIFAAMLPNSFDDGKRAAIANREALPCAAGDVKLAARGAVKNRVARENVAAS